MFSRLLTAEAVFGVQAIAAGAAGGVAQVAIEGAHVSEWVIFSALGGAVGAGLFTARDAFDTEDARPVAMIAFFAGVSTFTGAMCGIFMSEFLAGFITWFLKERIDGVHSFCAMFLAITAERFVGGLLKSFLTKIGGQ